jgi:hypothetical protein
MHASLYIANAMTGFGIKMQKSEFHCCIMVTTAFGRFSVYYTKFCVTD